MTLDYFNAVSVLEVFQSAAFSTKVKVSIFLSFWLRYLTYSSFIHSFIHSPHESSALA